MPKGKKATVDSPHSESSLSDVDETIEWDKDANISDDKQEFLDKVEIFRMMHENKCEDGKDILKETRIKDLNDLKALYDNLNYDISFAEYMVRSTLIRWLTFDEDMKYWRLWDKKEELMVKRRRNKARERDRLKALERKKDDGHRSRSRSRSRSRGRSGMRDILGDKSGESGGDTDDNKEKEHVK